MGIGWGLGILLSCFHEFQSSVVQDFKLFLEFSEICNFWDCYLGIGCELVNGW